LPDIDSLDVIELLVDHGADIHSTNDDGSILYTGIANSNLDMVAWGIGRGLSVNGRNDRGQTPLYWAVIEYDVDIVELLLKHDADPNIPSNIGRYPLQFVIQDYDRNIVILLLEYGADPYLISAGFRNRFYTDEIYTLIETYRAHPIKEPECE
jgi:ankyrin repeat protein